MGFSEVLQQQDMDKLHPKDQMGSQIFKGFHHPGWQTQMELINFLAQACND